MLCSIYLVAIKKEKELQPTPYAVTNGNKDSYAKEVQWFCQTFVSYTMKEFPNIQKIIILIQATITLQRKILPLTKLPPKTPLSIIQQVAETSTTGNKETSTHKSDIDINIPTNPQNNFNTFVLVIANENYKKVSRVPFAGYDGKTFEQYCIKTLGIPQTNIHTLTDATLNDMRHEIKWMQDIMSVYKGEAKVIFYYAGHGIPDEQSKNAYLLPIDGYGSDVTTGYSLANMYRILGEMPSKLITIFLDACFSGGTRNGNMLTSARGVAIKVKTNSPTGNMVVFTAAQGDETAYPYKERSHGLFTYYLLKKLQETKGNVTLGELGDYIQTQVKRQSVVTNGKLQSPAILTAPKLGNNWKNWKLK